MILSSLKFKENLDNENYWEIDGLNFEMFNLIVGLNATGKTRLVSIISNLTKMITKKLKIKLNDSRWELVFYKNKKNKFSYKLHIKKGEIVLEEIKEGRKVLLSRKRESGKIYSYLLHKKLTINPPKDELTLHVRRDVKEFPFLEDIYEWSKNFFGYKFTSARPDHLLVPVVT